MKNQKSILVGIGLTCIALIGAAIYLQQVERMLPCPWCVIQRYAFALIALTCLVTAALPARTTRAGTGLAFVASLAGCGSALWLLWVKMHPSVSCGIDPVETTLNKIAPAQWLPIVFQANGECSTEYPPIFGLTISQWSLAWFVLFTLVLGWLAFRRRR